MASKYSNKKTELQFQNQTYYFDSRLEASHAQVLFTMLKQGKISNLIFQKEFILCESTILRTNSTVSKKTKRSKIKYISDFYYEKDGKIIVADSKGMKTAIYSLKKNLFLSQLKEHGVDEFQELYKAEIIKYW